MEKINDENNKNVEEKRRKRIKSENIMKVKKRKETMKENKNKE